MQSGEEKEAASQQKQGMVTTSRSLNVMYVKSTT